MTRYGYHHFVRKYQSLRSFGPFFSVRRFIRIVSWPLTVIAWVFLLAAAIVLTIVVWQATGGRHVVQERPQEVLRTVAVNVPDPCSLNDVVCVGETMRPIRKTIYATITTYQAVPGQTDSTPCITAAGTDACHPKVPIVANNCLLLGTVVSIRGEKYRVDDRMNKRFGCDHFDVLTDGENYRLTNEPVTVL